MIKNITKMANEDDWPAQTVVFLTYITNEKSVIPNAFLLPFENKMINLRKGKPFNEEYAIKKKKLHVCCFVILKVLVAKILFKPYRIAEYLNIDIDTLKNKLTFKENCVSLGFTFIALCTDFLTDMFLNEIKETGISINDEATLVKIKYRLFNDLTPIPDQDDVNYQSFD